MNKCTWLLVLGLVCLVGKGISQTLMYRNYKKKVIVAANATKPSKLNPVPSAPESLIDIWEAISIHPRLNVKNISFVISRLGLQGLFDRGDLNYWHEAKPNPGVFVLEMAAIATLKDTIGINSCQKFSNGELSALADLLMVDPTILDFIRELAAISPGSFFQPPPYSTEIDGEIEGEFEIYQPQIDTMVPFFDQIAIYKSDVERVKKMLKDLSVQDSKVQSEEAAIKVVQYFGLDRICIPNVNLVWLPGDYMAVSGKNYVGGSSEKLMRDCAAFRLMLDTLNRNNLIVLKSNSLALSKVFLQIIDKP